jgi:hypothetical protein
LKSNYTIDDIWNAFVEVEADEQLVDFKVGSIYLWPLLRDRLMRDVAETLGVYEKREDPEKVAELAGDKSIVASFIKSPYAVVPFLRRDENGAEPFSDFIVEALRGEGIEPLIFGMGKSDIGSGRPQIEVLERDFLRHYRNRAKLMVAPTIRGSHRARYARVLSALAFHITGDGAATVTSRYQAFPRWLLVDFYAQRLGFKKFFKSAGVKTLVVVNAWKRALIAGAQEAGVWVVEPQHGLLSSRLPLLSWHGTDVVDYLPNQLLVWGSYWGQVVDAPTVVERTVIGAPAKLAALQAQNIEHKPGTVLIVSQVQQTSKILDLAIRAAVANPELKFVLKPHPQEKPITMGDISSRVSQLPENLQFANPASSALPMLSRAEYVVGVHSMALIEALALGAKVLAIKLPGFENIQPFVNRGDITLVDADSDLTKELALSRVAPRANEYFAQPVSAKRLVEILEGDSNA